MAEAGDHVIFEMWVPGETWTTNKERNLHHFARSKLVSPLRQSAMVLTRNWRNQHGGISFKTPVYVEFRPVQGMRGPLADTANHLPPCKAVLDGVVDAGLIPEDNPEWVKWQTFMPPLKGREQGVTIRLCALSPDL